MASSLVQFMPSFWGIVNSRNNPKCKISAGPSDAVTTVSRKNLSAPQQGQTKWLLLHPNTNFIKTHTIKRQPTLYYGRNLKHNPSSLKYKGRNAKESARAYIIYYKHKLDIPEQHLVQNRSTNTHHHLANTLSSHPGRWQRHSSSYLFSIFWWFLRYLSCVNLSVVVDILLLANGLAWNQRSNKT